MDAEIRLETGFDEALYGLSLSHNVDVSEGLRKRMVPVAHKLAHKQGGHNKFLESIVAWVDVRAPRYWWQEADTYRLSTKQSESTMHTVTKRALRPSDFAESLPVGWLDTLNDCVRVKNWYRLKQLLPESFMQRRLWLVSYKTLQNIFYQRGNHRLPEWREFLEQVSCQLEYPEWVERPSREESE